MLKFDANLTFLFGEVPFFDRFDAARRAGFTHAEFLAVPASDTNELLRAVRESGLHIVQYNFLDGDLAAGERGFASHPDQRERWREAFEQALDLARQIHPNQIHSIVGVRRPEIPREAQMATLIENLQWAAPRLEAAGIPLMVEPLNDADNPGYLIQTVDSALVVLERAGSPRIRLQFDFYHTQRAQGDIIRRMQAAMPRIGHMQIADNPGRHEPGTGEIGYRNVLRAVQDAGYARYIGLEYRPMQDTESSLAWLPVATRGRPCDVSELML
jgi:hydroxypyruvate isomerase